MRNKLINLLKNDSCKFPMLCGSNCKYANLKRCYEERTADYLLENGVIVLPVKPGGYIYMIEDGVVNELYICGIDINEKNIWLSYLWYGGEEELVLYVSTDEINKTVFLTAEEAERALKEREENA